MLCDNFDVVLTDMQVLIANKGNCDTCYVVRL